MHNVDQTENVAQLELVAVSLVGVALDLLIVITAKVHTVHQIHIVVFERIVLVETVLEIAEVDHAAVNGVGVVAGSIGAILVKSLIVPPMPPTLVELPWVVQFPRISCVVADLVVVQKELVVVNGVGVVGDQIGVTIVCFLTVVIMLLLLVDQAQPEPLVLRLSQRLRTRTWLEIVQS